MRHPTLKNVHSKDNFVVVDGKKLRNIHQLLETVVVMNDKDFEQHVNDDKHDFHKWVKEVHKDAKLAKTLKNANSQQKVARAIGARIDEIKENDPGLFNAGSHLKYQWGAVGIATVMLLFVFGITTRGSGITSAAIVQTGSGSTGFATLMAILAVVTLLFVSMYVIRHKHHQKI